MAARLGDTMVRAGLYRNTTHGKIAGVCAGISDRMGIKRLWVRIAFVAFAILTHGIGILAYLVLAILMPAREENVVYAAPGLAAPMGPPPGPAGPMGPPPGVRVMDVRTRFTALEARLSRIEAVITSNELSLRRKFRDLGSD